jgi:hypothetical protein
VSDVRSPLAWVADLGAAAQAVVPGLYAWAVTVAPCAWGRAPLGARFAAGLALLALLTPLAPEPGDPVRASRRRALGTWVFVLASALTFLAAPAALAPARLGAARGLAGMLGWGLYAFAAAAPALPRAREENQAEPGLAPRQTVRRGDAIYLVVGALAAAALQLVGWSVSTPERAVLLRMVTLMGGLGLVGASARLAIARHGRRAPARRSLRAAGPWLVGLIVLLGIGLAYRLHE